MRPGAGSVAPWLEPTRGCCIPLAESTGPHIEYREFGDEADAERPATLLHVDLAAWADQPPQVGPKLDDRPAGYRALMWCPYANEPAILEWRGSRPYCPNCNGNFEPETHAFIGRVLKPRF